MNANAVVSYFQDHKVQYQKFNSSCSFFIHKAHWIIRHIK